MSNSINICLSISDCEFRVAKHELVLHTHQPRPMLSNEFEKNTHREAMNLFNVVTEITSITLFVNLGLSLVSN